MPNHIHGIIEIREDVCRNAPRLPVELEERILPNLNGNVGTGHCPVLDEKQLNTGTERCSVPTGNKSQFGKVLPKSISTIIGSYKSICTKIINQKYPDLKFSWQSRFYDRIIRNEKELNQIRQYIMDNPLKWAIDKNLPAGKADNPENLYM